MKTQFTLFALTVSAAVGSLWTAPAAQADPLPGEVLKFQQLPLNNTQVFGQVYQGHDELSTAWLDTSGLFYRGTFMADDFADKLSSPIVHLKWWGSYIANPNQGSVPAFMIAIETDVPGNSTAGTFSHPGMPMLTQVVTPGALLPGSGTFTETLINGNVPEHLYQYNAELSVPFPEQKDTVYWLKIVALSQDSALQWGWHNRDYTVMDPFASPLVSPGETNLGPAVSPIWHFQDDAVTGGVDIIPNPVPGSPTVNQYNMSPTNYIDIIDGPPGIGQYSKDLAFEIYTVPEPAAPVILGLALTAMILRRPRRA